MINEVKISENSPTGKGCICTMLLLINIPSHLTQCNEWKITIPHVFLKFLNSKKLCKKLVFETVIFVFSAWQAHSQALLGQPHSPTSVRSGANDNTAFAASWFGPWRVRLAVWLCLRRPVEMHRQETPLRRVLRLSGCLRWEWHHMHRKWVKHRCIQHNYLTD